MALRAAGCTAVLEPDVSATFITPTWRPADDEMPFFRYRWDLEGARRNREEIRERWHLVETPGDMGFVEYRNFMARLPEVQRDLRALDALPGETLLLDDGDWFGTDMLEGLSMRPFPELERAGMAAFHRTKALCVNSTGRSRADAERVVVGYPAHWWFDYLPALRNAPLRSRSAKQKRQSAPGF